MQNILVIDDTPFWRDMTAGTLRRNGYEVRTASDGLDGLRLLAQHCPDLLILDVEMPHMEGFAFLEEMRRRNEWRAVPVIMLTGDMLKDHVLRAKSLGAVEYILKARFSPKELLERVRRRLHSDQANDPTVQGKHGVSASPTCRTPSITEPTLVALIEMANAVTPPARLLNDQDLQQAVSGVSGDGPDIPALVAREEYMESAQPTLSTSTLSDVIAEVIALTQSAQSDISSLTKAIMRDSVLTARVLQAANTMSQVPAPKRVSSIQEAVRNIGCTGVRNIAVALEPSAPNRSCVEGS